MAEGKAPLGSSTLRADSIHVSISFSIIPIYPHLTPITDMVLTSSELWKLKLQNQAMQQYIERLEDKVDTLQRGGGNFASYLSPRPLGSARTSMRMAGTQSSAQWCIGACPACPYIYKTRNYPCCLWKN